MLALKEFWKYKCYSKPEYNYVKSEKKFECVIGGWQQACGRRTTQEKCKKSNKSFSEKKGE